ncbi:MAG: transporter substrate-binding domain-containing protein [Rhodoferax sp.]|nr:transporter substrate-binding domain-containing protein [Rhodoferax sp.]
MTRMPKFSPRPGPWLAGLLLAASSTALLAQAPPPPPPPGASPRIDAIRKAGDLRVGVLSNAPWLNENTSGDDKPTWSGPAWILANEYARLLGVKLRPVQVSHETKIPVLASNQVDMSITPLAETPERMKVVDFVIYSNTSVCMFGRAGNSKLAKINTVDGLNSPDITIAYFTGGAEENWVKERFPKAKLRGVASSGGTAPVEEILAKRADAAPINRVSWVSLNHKVKGLVAYPKENNCQSSQEKASPVGLAIDKNQPVYLNWLRQVEKTIQAKLTANESAVVEHMK